MSETHMEPPALSEINEPPRQSPWIMLISIVLLIVGLLLTSFMMLFYAWQHAGKSKLESFNLSAFVQQRHAISLPVKNPEKKISTQAAPAKTVPLPKAVATQKKGETVRWPRLKLSGFGASADGTSGFAILNGEQVLQGETAGKIKLLDVKAHAVIVEYMGEQKTLTMGIEN